MVELSHPTGNEYFLLSTHPKLTCASAAWLRKAVPPPPVPTGVAMALLLFDPFFEPPATKEFEPLEELKT